MAINVDTDSNDALDIGYGGTGSQLTDPGADRVLFWDDSAAAGSNTTWLAPGNGLSITGTTLNVTWPITFTSDYSSDFDAAVVAIGATATTLYVNDATTMSTSVTVPATCTVIILKGGSIDQAGNTLTFSGSVIMQGGSITSDAALTINNTFTVLGGTINQTSTVSVVGSFIAGDQYIFTGSGAVSFAPNAGSGALNNNPEIRARWFIDPDGADHTTQIQRAIDACNPGVAPVYGDYTSGQTIIFTPGTYLVSSTINLQDGVGIRGAQPEGSHGAGETYKGSTIFYSSISGATSDVFKLAYTDDASQEYFQIRLSNFMIHSEATDRDGIRIEGYGNANKYLFKSHINDVSIVNVGGSGIYFGCYTIFMGRFENISIWNPGTNGLTFELDYVGGYITNAEFRNVLVNSPDGYAFVLNPLSGACFYDCKNDGSGGTISGGWYLVNSKNNVFYRSAHETYSPATGNILTITAESDFNTFIEPYFQADEQGGMVFEGSSHNRFYGGHFDGEPTNTTNFITFDATSDDNVFHDSRFISYDYDDLVSDLVGAGGPNMFKSTRMLSPGTMVPATTPYSLWWTAHQVPQDIMFGNSVGRRHTQFSDIFMMGRILVGGTTTAVTSLTANTLDVEHITVKQITLDGADNLTTLSNGSYGQIITLIFGNGNTTLVDGAFLNLSGAANWNPGADDTIQLVCLDATVWYEVSRSVN